MVVRGFNDNRRQSKVNKNPLPPLQGAAAAASLTSSKSKVAFGRARLRVAPSQPSVRRKAAHDEPRVFQDFSDAGAVPCHVVPYCLCELFVYHCFLLGFCLAEIAPSTLHTQRFARGGRRGGQPDFGDRKHWSHLQDSTVFHPHTSNTRPTE